MNVPKWFYSWACNLRNLSYLFPYEVDPLWKAYLKGKKDGRKAKIEAKVSIWEHRDVQDAEPIKRKKK